MENPRDILLKILDNLKQENEITGIFIAGSLTTDIADHFSDLDIGVAIENNPSKETMIYQKYPQYLESIGKPIHMLERSWDHCKMVASLFSKETYPPYGLEVDLIFSQLQYITEQMPYAQYEILYDKIGEVEKALKNGPTELSDEEKRKNLVKLLNYYPFYVYEAVKAERRKDVYHLWTELFEIRNVALQVIALVKDRVIFDTKRARRNFSKIEQDHFKETYYKHNLTAIVNMVSYITEQLESLKEKLDLQEEIDSINSIIQNLL